MSKRKQSQRNKKKTSDRVPSDTSTTSTTSNRAAVWSIVHSRRFYFAAAFVLSCTGLYALIHVLPDSFTRPLNEHTASTLGLVLNFFGISVSTVSDIVSGGGVAFKIVPECTPLFTAGLFLCFVIFYPATVRQKAAGFLMGIPALYLGNLVRLAAIFMVSRYDRRLFEVVHVYLGQVFTIFLVIISCLLWLKWLDRETSKQGIIMQAAGFLARFALLSACLFLVWMKVHHWYIWLLDRFMLFGFFLFGYRVPLAHDTVVYYETFSIVVFTSLVLAARSLPRGIKIKGLAAGLGFLFFTHLFHRIDNALTAYFNFTAALTVDLTLLLIGQYLLPVLFLIYLIRIQKIQTIRKAERILNS